jgi:CheY-like chemotaxis protein
MNRTVRFSPEIDLNTTTSATATSMAATTTRLRLVLVEDDAAARARLSKCLAGFGHDVIEVADAPDALAVIDASDPDAVLVDLTLPSRGEVSLLRRLLEDDGYVGLPLAVFTGSGGKAQLIRRNDSTGQSAPRRPSRGPSELEALLTAVRACAKRPCDRAA